MAQINLVKVGVGIGVGVVDDVLEDQDRKNGRTRPFERWTDWGRILAVAGGHALGMVMPRQFQLGEAIALAATPLATKTVISAVRAQAGGGSGQSLFARNRAGATAANWAPTNINASGWRAPS